MGGNSKTDSSSVRDGAYSCLQFQQICRTRRWAITPSRAEVHMLGVDPQIFQPGDRADGVVGVQRADDEVAGLGRPERQLGGLSVPDLADHDDLGIVTEERAQVLRERVPDAPVHLVLREVVCTRTRSGPRR